MKNYFIGQGTGTVAEFDTLEEMLNYHSNMNCLDRHFCKLYDYVKLQLIDGSQVGYPGWENKWRKWE